LREKEGSMPQATAVLPVMIRMPQQRRTHVALKDRIRHRLVARDYIVIDDPRNEHVTPTGDDVRSAQERWVWVTEETYQDPYNANPPIRLIVLSTVHPNIAEWFGMIPCTIEGTAEAVPHHEDVDPTMPTRWVVVNTDAA
jgi:hypothetical protein